MYGLFSEYSHIVECAHTMERVVPKPKIKGTQSLVRLNMNFVLKRKIV